MAPDIKAWMRPEDLALHQLNCLPWPAFLNLVSAYFEHLGYRVRLARGFDDRAEYLMVSPRGERRLLICCSSKAQQNPRLLLTVSRSVNGFGVASAVVVGPGLFPPQTTEAAREGAIDLYSATRITAMIERLPAESRRRVLDSIRASGDRRRTALIEE